MTEKGGSVVPDAAELIGRDAEQRVLTGVLDQVLDANGSTLVLTGSAGIGKTALLRHAILRARALGMSVLSVTAVPTEAQLPYAGAHQLLRPLLVDQAPDTQMLWDAAIGGAGEPDRPVERYRLALSVLSSVTTGTGRGRILVVDDAQWLDQESWDVLAFVGRRIAQDRVALLMGMRDGEESHARLSGSGLPEHPVEPLPGEAAAALLRASAPGLTPALAQRVLGQAAGNPLGLIELGIAAGALEHGAPVHQELALTARLERTYARTLSQLPLLTRSMILVAALDDTIALGEILAIVARMHGRQATVDELEPAIAAGLLVIDGESVEFRHPLIRWTVARSASASVRLATHAAIADALDGQEARQVWHRAAATLGSDSSVAERLARLASHAHQQSSPETALRAWERSAQLSPPGPLRARRLMAAARSANHLSNYAKITSLLQQIPDDDVSDADRTELEWLRRQSLGLRWPFDQSFAALVELAARLQSEGRTDLAQDGLSMLAVLCWWVDLQPVTRRQIVEVIEQMQLPDLNPTHISVIAMVSPLEHGRVSIARLDAARVLAHDVDANHALGAAASGVGHLRAASAFLATATSAARKLGRFSILAQALVSQALVAALLGDAQLALTCAQEAQRVALETNQQQWALQGRLIEALATALTAGTDPALPIADELEAVLLASGARTLVAQIALIRGVAHLAQGAASTAFDELRAMFVTGDLHFHEYARYWALSHLAEAAALAGRLDELRIIVDECAPVAEISGWPSLQMSLHYARALLAGDDNADAGFTDALAAVPADWPLERARLQLSYGAWLRRHRRVFDSRGPLRAAQQTFEGLGLEPWAERAREELRASGEHPRRGGTAWTALTPQELQIARLAASGLTNPEIAEQLFLAPSTVSTHLHRVYRKVGVTGRKQLAKVLSGT